MAHKIRISEFDSILQADVINLSKLQKLSFNGIPDEGGRRALCWCLLLDYLPLQRNQWDAHLSEKRKQYYNFVDDIITKQANLSNSSSSEALQNGLSSISLAGEVSSTSSYSNSANVSPEKTQLPPVPQSVSCNSLCSDHPLSLSPDSEWGEYFKDNQTLAQIDKDVRRLCPDMCFFQRLTKYPRVDTPKLSSRVTNSVLQSEHLDNKFSSFKSKRKTNPSPSTETVPPGEEAHWEVVERILFIYAKLNPGQGYVQGMNEIIGPLYYVLATADSHAENAEADCFFLFTSLMSNIRDLFIRTLDESESGIGRLMTTLMRKLQMSDKEVYDVLLKQGIKEQYFAFRWLSLLFCQEFALPDVIRVWDSLLARSDPSHSFMVSFATAMISMQRDSLLRGDFAANMQLLQNYPPCDIVQILNKALQISQ